MVKKPQKSLIFQLFSTPIVVKGKATFLNMSRYGSISIDSGNALKSQKRTLRVRLDSSPAPWKQEKIELFTISENRASEKRFRRCYRRTSDFFMINWPVLPSVLSKSSKKIATLDTTFITKTGDKTNGLVKCWRDCTSRSEQGLELPLFGVVDLNSDIAYDLEALQAIDEEDKCRVDLYVEQVVSHAKILLKQSIQYFAVDAYYFKEKFVTAVVETGLHVVGKLRNYADLKWLYNGPYSGIGRPKVFDGKVNRFVIVSGVLTFILREKYAFL